MKNDKTEKMIDFLEKEIAELTEYANSDNYDDLEKHDCRIAIEAYKNALKFARELTN